MRPTPVAQVRDVAAEGENMPPKSTYFFPKLLTGLLFNPLVLGGSAQYHVNRGSLTALERSEMSGSDGRQG